MKSKYAQAESALLERIQTERIKVGGRIPSELALQRDLGVSRVTIRKAIGNLVRAGVLESRPGVGHVVKSAEPRVTVAMLFNYPLFEPHTPPFFPLLFQEVRRELRRRGCACKLYLPPVDDVEHHMDYQRLIRDIERGRFSAMLGLYWPQTDEADAPGLAAQNRRLRQVLQERDIACACLTGQDVPNSTSLDYYQAGYRGTRYFLDRGLDRIALLTRPGMRDVHEGYQAALSEAGRSDSAAQIIAASDLSEAAGYETFTRLWNSLAPANRPQAVVIPDDLMTKGAAAAATRLSAVDGGEVQIAGLHIKGSRPFFPMPVVRLEIDPQMFVRSMLGQMFTLIEQPEARLPKVYIAPQVVEPGA